MSAVDAMPEREEPSIRGGQPLVAGVRSESYERHKDQGAKG